MNALDLPGPGVLHSGYGAEMGAFDELLGPDGAPRAHWARLLHAFGQLGPEDLEQRRRDARRLFRENGLTFSAGPGTASRPYDLDPIPHLVPPEAWAVLESGLRQRAQLLDAVLRDLYGPRHLLRQGVLPADLIYRHRGYLQGLVGAEGMEQALAFYGADVVRRGDGSFAVLGDRTQAPAGVGLALETRIVTSRILPNLIRASHVHRLASFFAHLRGAVVDLAPHQRLRPRIAVLASGISDPHYFDHAYLASYLGFPLLQAGDLTVREGRVWLRTIGGLKLLDVVLRRTGDHDSDALLVPGGETGVPGLGEAALRGEVALANGLGVSVLEHPGLMAYLPQLARQVLGEDLKLPSVETWWCGTAQGRQHVLANLETMVIKPIDRSGQALWGGALSREARESLRCQIEAEPETFVGQPAALEGTAATLVEGQLRPQAVLTRFFATRQGPDFEVMTGGFTRVAGPRGGPMALGSELRGLCKDTWVLADETERHLIRWPRAVPEVGPGTPEQLPSRVADNLYWVGRYAERAEGLARMARAVLRHAREVRDYGDPADALALGRLLDGFCALAGVASDAFPHRDDVLLTLLLDEQQPGSLPQTLQRLGQAAEQLKDRWAPDASRVLDEIGQRLAQAQELSPQALGAIEEALDPLITALLTFSGLSLESMTREQGWRFLMIGRRLERAQGTATLLAETLAEAADSSAEPLILESLLRANDSVMTHRRRYRALLDPASFLEVLLLDEQNPRSVAFQLQELEVLLQALPRGKPGLAPEQRALLEVRTALRLTDAEALAAQPVTGGAESRQRRALQSLLEILLTGLSQASGAVDDAYFLHLEAARPMALRGQGGKL